jgi:hypothetical protein
MVRLLPPEVRKIVVGLLRLAHEDQSSSVLGPENIGIVPTRGMCST